MSLQTQTVEIAMVDPGPDHALFDEAIEAIQTSISEEHRRTFRHHTDIPSLLEDLRAICAANAKEHRRLLACSRKITLFIRAFAPYFDVLSICVQVRQDWVGWFWGILRLMFKVGSNYVLFLEKVADMYEAIAHALPGYRQTYESYDHQLSSSTQGQDDQLTALISYVYADITHFSLDLYEMFSRRIQGARWRHAPFESSPSIWRPLDSRFSHLESRLLQHRRWLRIETESTGGNTQSNAEYRREYIEFLNQQAAANGNRELERHRMARRLKRVDKVKAWLSNCCAYREAYENRGQQRHHHSCAWFLSTTEYCDWKNTPFDQGIANDMEELESNWCDRVLFVQAKPGFGKTFIAAAAIDDLNAEAEDLNISDEPPSSAFFHFNSADSCCAHPNDAFRALAHQLVHTHRHDRSTLDAICLLMRNTPSIEKASSDDVLAVLSLLLQQHPTYLVIDGIDESSSVEAFLTLLPEVCRKSDTRVLLFGRPKINIPLEYQKWASNSPHIVSLRDEQNAQDIEDYMTTHLNGLADQGFFGISMDRTVITKVAKKSHGVFLWASLLLKYLQSPVLTSNERRAVLEHVENLESLDALYRSILNMLDRRPEDEKRVVADVFRWLTLSINKLCLPALQSALAITSSRLGADSDSVFNLAELLPQYTCGLVEVTNNSIFFAHKSVKEYLQSSACKDSHFSLHDEGKEHAILAARCLSYLVHDVPKRPLRRLQPFMPSVMNNATSSGLSLRTSRSGDSGYKSVSSDTDNGPTITNAPTTSGLALTNTQTVPDTTFDLNLPFLRYASLCWPIHLSRALSHASPNHFDSSTAFSFQHSQPPFLPALYPYLGPLSSFLNDRLAVTAWVEASWRYSLPPNLCRLIPPLNLLRSEIPPTTTEGRELRLVLYGIRQLSDALIELKGEYATTLRENPSLIWQRGVVGNNKSNSNANTSASTSSSSSPTQSPKGFWPIWDEGIGEVDNTEALL